MIEFGKRCVIILRITKRNHLSGINTSYWSSTVGGHSRLHPCVGHSHPLLDFSAPPYLQIEDIYFFIYSYSSHLIDPPPLLTICLTHGQHPLLFLLTHYFPHIFTSPPPHPFLAKSPPSFSLHSVDKQLHLPFIVDRCLPSSSSRGQWSTLFTRR